MASVKVLDTPPPKPLENQTLSQLSQEEQDALKAAVFQRLHPRLYLERYIAEEVRPDGRAFDAFRDVSVNVGEAGIRTFTEETQRSLTFGVIRKA